MMNEVARVYFQKYARQLGYWSALRAMRSRGYTPAQCRETLSMVRYYARVR
jgi:hypothetical protein